MHWLGLMYEIILLLDVMRTNFSTTGLLGFERLQIRNLKLKKSTGLLSYTS